MLEISPGASSEREKYFEKRTDRPLDGIPGRDLAKPSAKTSEGKFSDVKEEPINDPLNEDSNENESGSSAGIHVSSLGYWRTFDRVQSPHDKRVKEIKKLCKREPQKYWFPMGKSVSDMLMRGPIHFFFNNDGFQPSVCITMFEYDRLHEIMGCGDSRAVEPLYQRAVDEFILKNRKLTAQVEALRQEVGDKGWQNLTEEEKTVAIMGGCGYPWGPIGTPQNKTTGGGLIWTPGMFSSSSGGGAAAAGTATAAASANFMQAKHAANMKKEMMEKIKKIQDKLEQQRQMLEMDKKVKTVMDLMGAFGTNKPLSMGQLDSTLAMLADTVVGSMISSNMTLATITQLDDYLKNSSIPARMAADPKFKQFVDYYKTNRKNLVSQINQRNQNNQSNQNQAQQQQQTQSQTSQPPNPPPGSPPGTPPGTPPPPPTPPPGAPPGTPPSAPPSAVKPPPTLMPIPKPGQKQNIPKSPNQVFQQGIEDALEEGLSEPEPHEVDHGKPKSKRSIPPNSRAVKPDHGRDIKK